MKKSPAFIEIAENLTFLDDWEDRYRYIIELGQALAPLDRAEHNAQNKVNGCVSQAWLVSERREIDGALGLVYRGDSDAMIVKGLVAILIALYSGQAARDIADTDALAIFDEIGLREHLSTQRSNGLIAMVNRMRAEANALI